MILYGFTKSKVKHNEILKVIAVIAMLIDHIGFVFFPEHSSFRIIGRIAFPIFAYQLAIGYTHSSNPKMYMVRLWTFAIISQIPYTLLFETYNLNILFTLLLSILLIDRIAKNEWYWIPTFIIIVTLPQFIDVLPKFEYGWYGLFMPVLFYIFSHSKIKAFISQTILLILYVFIGNTFFIQIFAWIGIFICLYFPINKWKIHVNKYFFYWFYPAHLTILFILKWTILFLLFPN